MLQLKGRVSELEAELAEQQHLRQQAADDCEFLRAELDELRRQREDTEKAQRSLSEIESERWVGAGAGPGGQAQAAEPSWTQDAAQRLGGGAPDCLSRNSQECQLLASVQRVGLSPTGTKPCVRHR